MKNKKQDSRRIVSRDQSRIDKNSVFFEKVVPVLLIAMAALTALLILFAIGVLVGIVKF